jgi:hypothetical protein
VADPCIFGPQMLIFGAGEKAPCPVRIHALVVSAKLTEDCIQP